MKGLHRSVWVWLLVPPDVVTNRERQKVNASLLWFLVASKFEKLLKLRLGQAPGLSILRQGFGEERWVEVWLVDSVPAFLAFHVTYVGTRVVLFDQ